MALYTDITATLDVWHRPTQRWIVNYRSKVSVRAVSRKDAIRKALRQVEAWPGYAERVNLPDFEVSAEVSLVGARMIERDGAVMVL